MKKSIRKAFVMAMALVLVMAMAAVAQADTIISPAFTLPGAEARPTEDPTVEPTASPEGEAAPEPTAEPTEEPDDEPQITLAVRSNLAGRDKVMEGTVMILTVDVAGADGYDYTIRWQQTKDGVTWEDIPGATGAEYTLELRPEHSGMYWRACLDITDRESVE